jgi:mannosyltransferase OCH1-like enzyme
MSQSIHRVRFDRGLRVTQQSKETKERSTMGVSKHALLLLLTTLVVWSLIIVHIAAALFKMGEWNCDKVQNQEPEAKSILQTRGITPLQTLAKSDKTVECKEGLLPVYDSLLDPQLAFQDRKIPRIVHLTSRSRCMHPVIASNVDTWRLPGHSLFLHDDDAMDELLYRDWPEFPQLKYVLKCLIHGGAAKADIWRVLVLWEYGGIYADVDSRPNAFNATTITADDDAFFVIENEITTGMPSQWFMAASPRHPMMYTTMQVILANLVNLRDVGDFPIVWTTGPGAVNDAFGRFLGRNMSPLVAGTHMGLHDRSVTMVGSVDADQNDCVIKNIYMTIESLRRPDKDIHEAKHEVYQAMEMAHHSTFGVRDKRNFRNESCIWRMWQEEMSNALYWTPNW